MTKDQKTLAADATRSSRRFLMSAAATLLDMMRQKLRWIHIEGFTSIYESAVELRDLNVLVGANGAGKSNLIRFSTNQNSDSIRSRSSSLPRC